LLEAKYVEPGISPEAETSPEETTRQEVYEIFDETMPIDGIFEA
jgi:hypothetical protein